MKLVFDTSPLSCFARADLLDLLEQLTQGHECVVPRAVLDELRVGAPRFPLLQKVAALPWLAEVRCDTLGGGPRRDRAP